MSDSVAGPTPFCSQIKELRANETCRTMRQKEKEPKPICERGYESDSMEQENSMWIRWRCLKLDGSNPEGSKRTKITPTKNPPTTAETENKKPQNRRRDGKKLRVMDGSKADCIPPQNPVSMETVRLNSTMNEIIPSQDIHQNVDWIEEDLLESLKNADYSQISVENKTALNLRIGKLNADLSYLTNTETSTIYLLKLESGEELVIKEIKNRLKPEEEIKTMRAISGQGVIKFYGSTQSESRGSHLIIMEKLTDTLEHMNEKNPHQNASNPDNIFYKRTSESLSSLLKLQNSNKESNGITVHGDYKPNNIGMTKDGKLVVFDLGNTRHFSLNAEEMKDIHYKFSVAKHLSKTATASRGPEFCNGLERKKEFLMNLRKAEEGPAIFLEWLIDFKKVRGDFENSSPSQQEKTINDNKEAILNLWQNGKLFEELDQTKKKAKDKTKAEIKFENLYGRLIDGFHDHFLIDAAAQLTLNPPKYFEKVVRTHDSVGAGFLIYENLYGHPLFKDCLDCDFDSSSLPEYDKIDLYLNNKILKAFEDKHFKEALLLAQIKRCFTPADIRPTISDLLTNITNIQNKKTSQQSDLIQVLKQIEIDLSKSTREGEMELKVLIEKLERDEKLEKLKRFENSKKEHEKREKRREKKFERRMKRLELNH
jgi:hypothetical protein